MTTVKDNIRLRKQDLGQNRAVKRASSSGTGGKAKKLKIEKGGTSHVDESFSSVGNEKTAKKVVKSIKSEKAQKKHAKVNTAKAKVDEICSEPNEATSCGVEKPNVKARKKEPKKTKQNEFLSSWKDEDCLAEFEDISVTTAKNIIGLLNEENTIPFIARYRSHLTGDLKPDKLRKIRETYEYIKQVHEKASQIHKQLVTAKVLTPELLQFIQTARSLEELDFIGSQFKKGSKRTLAERARQLGLQSAAEVILAGKEVLSLESLVNPKESELNDVKKVRLGIQHIIADIISKTAEVHSHLEKIYSSNLILLKSEFKNTKEQRTSSKYHVYGEFSRPLHTIKPYQTLAISRGEAENELSVKIVIPDSLWLPVKTFCKKKWLENGIKYQLRWSLLADSVDDAVKRLLAPLAVRRIRARLNAEAENEALSVFGYNLRQLLMTSPCTGHVVMGIDPGFRNGCKVAVVSHTGNLLGHDKFFLNDPVTSRKKLKSLISEFKCEIIALGNGTGCRETEALLSKFIHKGFFKPLNVSYTIISEQAVSIYSCSPIAAEEFPDLDPTIVGAISLARRLQNPLSELVKVEPKHLGVGMYQHDVKEKKLVTTLDEIVSECVSFVGVDVNSASLYLLNNLPEILKEPPPVWIKERVIDGLYRGEVCRLQTRDDRISKMGRFQQMLLLNNTLTWLFPLSVLVFPWRDRLWVRGIPRVAGLNTSKAQEIIKYRTQVCSFKRREDLKNVKGIKTQTFLQCAGFLRITPSTARCTRHAACQNDFNPLDETCIHPESYETAYKIMNLFGVKVEELGSESFVETIKDFSFTEKELAKYCECSDLSVSFLIDALKKPKNFDLRSLSPGPIFRREIKNLEELSPGQNLEGVVRNVVSFGAFVDLGVGIDGLIHTSKLSNTVLHLNNRVNVEVISVDKVTQRIQLKFLHLIE